jgi:hypothetical protein
MAATKVLPNSGLTTAPKRMSTPDMRSAATESACTDTGKAVAAGIYGVSELQAKSKSIRSPAHYLWAALIARIDEVFPLMDDDGAQEPEEDVDATADWDMPNQSAHSLVNLRRVAMGPLGVVLCPWVIGRFVAEGVWGGRIPGEPGGSLEVCVFSEIHF